MRIKRQMMNELIILQIPIWSGHQSPNSGLAYSTGINYGIKAPPPPVVELFHSVLCALLLQQPPLWGGSSGGGEGRGERQSYFIARQRHYTERSHTSRDPGLIRSCRHHLVCTDQPATNTKPLSLPASPCSHHCNLLSLWDKHPE